MNQDQVWSQVQEELRFQLAKRTYDMWLKNTSVLSTESAAKRGSMALGAVGISIWR